MEFLESLRRLEEDVDNYDDFEESPVHAALEKRFKSTLYRGKTLDGISLPVADVAVDLFQNVAEKNLGTFTRRHVAKFNRNGLVNPSSAMLGMMYARRLKRQKSDYLKTVTSTELFLVSMMLATKFLYDEGEDEEIFSDEWADSAKVDVKRVNELEREFLDAIDWDLFIQPDEFYEFLQQMETWIALNEGQRRGWFSYSDLSVLMEHRDWFHTMSQLLEQAAKVLGICLAVYSLCSATLCWSLLVMQHHSSIPGMSLDPANHSHVFHGLRPLKSTQVQSHQSEVILPPPEPNPAGSEDTTGLVSDLCPNCRQRCCENDHGYPTASGAAECTAAYSPLHPDAADTETCKRCQGSLAEDYWMRRQIAKAQSAMITFYQALLVAYNDASLDMPPKISLTTNPGTTRVQEINKSSGHQDRPETTLTPSEYPANLKCPHGLSKQQERLNSVRNINVDSNADTPSRSQCSICDGVARRGIPVLQDSVHLLPLSYVADGALGTATSTTPLIIA